MLDNVAAVTRRDRYQLVLQDLAQRSNPDALAQGYGPSRVTGLLEMQCFRRPLRRSFARQPRGPPGISASAPVGALTPALLDQGTGIPAIRPRCSGYFSTLESALLQRQEGQIVQSRMNLRDSCRDSGLMYSAYATLNVAAGKGVLRPPSTPWVSAPLKARRIAWPRPGIQVAGAPHRLLIRRGTRGKRIPPRRGPHGRGPHAGDRT